MKWINKESIKSKLSDKLVGKQVGFSYWTLLTVMGERIKLDNILNNARSMAFSFTLSVFPGVIFVFSLIPFLVTFSMFSDINFMIIKYLRDIMPADTFKVVFKTITEILKHKNFGLLSFGFLFATYFVTNGIMNMISTFNMVYSTKKTRSYIYDGLIALVIAFILTFAFIVTIFIVGASTHYFNELVSFLKLGDDYHIIAYLIQIIATFMLFLFSIASIYALAPSIKVRWKFFSVGAYSASTLCVLVTIIFTIYVNNFNTYNKLYGSVGAMIAFMVWIWLISLSLLIGYELNACLQLAERKTEKELIEKIKKFRK